MAYTAFVTNTPTGQLQWLEARHGAVLGDKLTEVQIQLTNDGVYALVEQRNGESAYTRV